MKIGRTRVRTDSAMALCGGNGGGGLASYYAFNGMDEKFWQTYVMKSSPWGDGFSYPYLFAWFGNYYFDETEGGCIPRVMTKWYDIHQHPEHYPQRLSRRQARRRRSLARGY